MEREQIVIFTDGSCYAKHPEKLGGYGVYIQWNGREYGLSSGYKNTTISRMELLAIYSAIKTIKTDIRCTVTLYSDSQYAINMIKEKGFDWKQGRLHNFENFDILDLIFKEIETHKKMRLKLQWVPGHRARLEDPIVAGNFVADHLANYKNHKTYIDDSQRNFPYL